MKAVMKDGPSGMARYAGDPEVQELLKQLMGIIQG